jgi:DNA-binding MarR family transcriptional regulator
MKPIDEGAVGLSDAPALVCAQRLMDVVPHVMQAFREEMRHHRAAEMSVPEFRTLSYIQRHEGTSITAITDHLGLSKASLSKIVARLEERSLIRRASDKADKRHHVLSLTAQGRRTLEEVERATLRSIAGRLTHLSPKDLALIVTALDLLQPAFELSG